MWCHARVRDANQIRPSAWHLDLALIDVDGTIIGSVSWRFITTRSREALRAAATKHAGPADQTFYRLTWEPVPPITRAAASLAAPEQFATAIRDRFVDLAEQHRLSIYDQLLPELDQLSAEHVAAALRQLGFDESVGRTFTADSEAARLGVLPRHARLFARMLEMLTEDGILRAGRNRIQSDPPA